ncbi:uncharacterized protein LOC132195093 [Neocloeon triangulifer]|uniref:uncharacterized protein LOC132195093 n=1 Tax=Neocloeon triangulifer TaxID=2078957 RepID=UPI00286F73E6|nr:uncharacterized protein LOC132195093 [Neocloeon triangulifer]
MHQPAPPENHEGGPVLFKDGSAAPYAGDLVMTNVTRNGHLMDGLPEALFCSICHWNDLGLQYSGPQSRRAIIKQRAINAVVNARKLEFYPNRADGQHTIQEVPMFVRRNLENLHLMPLRMVPILAYHMSMTYSINEDLRQLRQRMRTEFLQRGFDLQLGVIVAPLPGDQAQGGALLQGVAPQGAAPQGAAPNGAAPNGAAPQGAAPQGAAPNGAAPQAIVIQGQGLVHQQFALHDHGDAPQMQQVLLPAQAQNGGQAPGAAGDGDFA